MANAFLPRSAWAAVIARLRLGRFGGHVCDPIKVYARVRRVHEVTAPESLMIERETVSFFDLVVFHWLWQSQGSMSIVEMSHRGMSAGLLGALGHRTPHTIHSGY